MDYVLVKCKLALKPCALAGVAVIANVIISPLSQVALETVVVVAEVFVPDIDRLIIALLSVVFVTVTVTFPLVVC